MEQKLKYKNWDRNHLTGTWEVSLKIDGVNARIQNGVAKSKADKPLYNLSHFPDGLYEIYTGNWNDTISAVRTMAGTPVDLKHGYRLDEVDARLFVGVWVNPPKEHIQIVLDRYIALGYEGLVLRQGLTCLKVKKTYPMDIAIYGIYPGEGRNFGKVGSFLTRRGRVGTGLTDKQRKEYMDLPCGTIIEVEYSELTKLGKFRHPKFIRVRPDK